MFRHTLTIAIAVLGVGAFSASAASAAQRYASPTGSGTVCSDVSPCTIRQAVDGASNNDEVVVAPGDYTLTTTLATPYAITIRGVAGQSRPRLMFTGNGEGGQAQQGLQVLYGSILRYVEVDQAAGNDWPALSANGSSVDQVIAKGSELSSWTASIKDSTIRDSIVVASGNGGVALETDANGANGAGTYRNVTAIATGSGGVAIRVWALSGSVNVLAKNVIAQGGPGGDSVRAWASSGMTATITIDHSDWQGSATLGAGASIVEAGGNQSAGPAFVNAAAGDYHEAPGSATINAGGDQFLAGDFDVDGDPRAIGPIDIGADEFVVTPAVTTDPATAVTETSATLGGTVDPNGVPTAYWFEYGPTAAYGSTTSAADPGSGTGAVAATATLTGLSPGTTYHYRLVATNSGLTTYGADQTFTSATPPPPSPTATTSTASSTAATGAAPTTPISTPPAPQPAFVGVRLVSTRLSYRGRFVVLRLSCPTGTVARCAGTTKLTVRRRTASRPKVMVSVGWARFSIAAGNQATVRARVSRAGRRLLTRVRRVSGIDANTAHDGSGHSKKTVATVTIRRRRR